jgi:hypothetical protein
MQRYARVLLGPQPPATLFPTLSRALDGTLPAHLPRGEPTLIVARRIKSSHGEG